MKKLAVSALILALLLSCFTIVGSAEGKSLLASDPTVYGSEVAGGETAQAKIENGATVIWGSAASWPCITYDAPEADFVTANVETDVIAYDIEIDKGSTNIVFFMGGAGATTGSANDSISLCWLMELAPGSVDVGSGDLLPGKYTGSVKISDMINFKMDPAHAAYEHDFAPELVKDGEITFSGLKIYSVGGATVTIKKLEVINASDVPEETSEAASVAESSVAESSVAESSAAASSEASADDASSKAGDASEVSEVSGDETAPAAGFPWLIVIIGVAVVAVVIVVIIVLKNKKSAKK